ncbi:MAG: hypothetical protein FD148_1880 [Methylocystaceae bacterium]|nr:MAG: hypothetical protein FD148_1880 [Methylocystaceae bacterium]
MAIERVVFEADLGVEAAQLAVLGDDQRIDLQELHVLGDERRVELFSQRARLFGEIAGEAERGGDLAAVMRHQPRRRIDREGHDLLGRVMRHLFDVHAAFGRDHIGDARRRAVDQHREIEFLVDRGAVFDVEAVDLLAGLAGLLRHERRAKHLFGEGFRLVDRFGDAHAALVAGARFLELALAAPAGVDLRLHHIDRAGKLFSRRPRIFGAQHGEAFSDGRAEVAQNGLGLIFVDVHGLCLPGAMARRRGEKIALNGRRGDAGRAAILLRSHL